MADQTDNKTPAPVTPADAPATALATAAVPAKVKPVKSAATPAAAAKPAVAPGALRALAVRNGKGFVSFSKPGQKTKAMRPLPAPIDGTAEFHASNLKTPAWKLAAAKAHMRWPSFGAVCTEEQFKAAVEAAANVKINAR